MKKMWQRLQLNKKGLSLVELISVIAIMGIVGAAIGTVVWISAKSYSRGMEETELQKETQFIADSIGNLIVDSNSEVLYEFLDSDGSYKPVVGAPGEDTRTRLIIKNNNAPDAQTYIIYFTPAAEGEVAGKLTYRQGATATSNIETGSGFSGEEVFAEHVRFFSVDLSDFKTNRNVIIRVVLEGVEGRSIESNYMITSRNGASGGNSTNYAFSASLYSESEIWMEPGQKYELMMNLMGFLTNRELTIDNLSGVNSTGTSIVYDAASSAILLKLGLDETGDGTGDIRMKVVTNEVYPAGTPLEGQPMAEQWITVHVRRVNGEHVAGVLKEGTMGLADSVYLVESTTSGTYLNQALGASSDTDPYAYKNPYYVEWSYEVKDANGVVKSSGSLDSVGAGGSWLSVSEVTSNDYNPHIRVKLKNSLTDEGSYDYDGYSVEIICRAVHPEGKDSAGNATNKATQQNYDATPRIDENVDYTPGGVYEDRFIIKKPAWTRSGVHDIAEGRLTLDDLIQHLKKLHPEIDYENEYQADGVTPNPNYIRTIDDIDPLFFPVAVDLWRRTYYDVMMGLDGVKTGVGNNDSGYNHGDGALYKGTGEIFALADTKNLLTVNIKLLRARTGYGIDGADDGVSVDMTKMHQDMSFSSPYILTYENNSAEGQVTALGTGNPSLLWLDLRQIRYSFTIGNKTLEGTYTVDDVVFQHRNASPRDDKGVWTREGTNLNVFVAMTAAEERSVYGLTGDAVAENTNFDVYYRPCRGWDADNRDYFFYPFRYRGVVKDTGNSYTTVGYKFTNLQDLATSWKDADGYADHYARFTVSTADKYANRGRAVEYIYEYNPFFDVVGYEGRCQNDTQRQLMRMIDGCAGHVKFIFKDSNIYMDEAGRPSVPYCPTMDELGDTGSSYYYINATERFGYRSSSEVTYQRGTLNSDGTVSWNTGVKLTYRTNAVSGVAADGWYADGYTLTQADLDRLIARGSIDEFEDKSQGAPIYFRNYYPLSAEGNIIGSEQVTLGNALGIGTSSSPAQLVPGYTYRAEYKTDYDNLGYADFIKANMTYELYVSQNGLWVPTNKGTITNGNKNFEFLFTEAGRYKVVFRWNIPDTLYAVEREGRGVCFFQVTYPKFHFQCDGNGTLSWGTASNPLQMQPLTSTTYVDHPYVVETEASQAMAKNLVIAKVTDYKIQREVNGSWVDDNKSVIQDYTFNKYNSGKFGFGTNGVPGKFRILPLWENGDPAYDLNTGAGIIYFNVPYPSITYKGVVDDRTVGFDGSGLTGNILTYKLWRQEPDGSGTKWVAYDKSTATFTNDGFRVKTDDFGAFKIELFWKQGSSQVAVEGSPWEFESSKYPEVTFTKVTDSSGNNPIWSGSANGLNGVTLTHEEYRLYFTVPSGKWEEVERNLTYKVMVGGHAVQNPEAYVSKFELRNWGDLFIAFQLSTPGDVTVCLDWKDSGSEPYYNMDSGKGVLKLRCEPKYGEINFSQAYPASAPGSGSEIGSNYSKDASTAGVDMLTFEVSMDGGHTWKSEAAASGDIKMITSIWDSTKGNLKFNLLHNGDFIVRLLWKGGGKYYEDYANGTWYLKRE